MLRCLRTASIRPALTSTRIGVLCSLGGRVIDYRMYDDGDGIRVRGYQCIHRDRMEYCSQDVVHKGFEGLPLATPAYSFSITSMIYRLYAVDPPPHRLHLQQTSVSGSHVTVA